MKRKLSHRDQERLATFKKRATIPTTTVVVPATNQRIGYSSVPRTRGGAVTGEMKYFDTSYSNNVGSSATWAATMADPVPFSTLCAPIVGAGVNNRIGKAIKVLKIKVRGALTLPPVEAGASTIAPCYVRLFLVQDKQSNATQMSGGLLMTAGTSVLTAPFSFQNIDNFGRFIVLKDKMLTVQDPNMAGTDASHDANGRIVHFKFTHSFRDPVDVRFNATNGGTISDIVDNSWHIVANGSTTSANLAYSCRVCYKE